jgi:hypothetical protein
MAQGRTADVGGGGCAGNAQWVEGEEIENGAWGITGDPYMITTYRCTKREHKFTKSCEVMEDARDVDEGCEAILRAVMI